MISGIRQRMPSRTRAGPGGRRSLAGLLVPMLAVTLVCLPGIGQEWASGEPLSATAGVGVSIPRSVKVRFASPFDPNPRYMAGVQTTSVEDPAPRVAAAEIVVTSNDVKWGVIVRLTLPKGREQQLANSTARCRLLTPDGKLVSERQVDAADVFLEGNGKCGEQSLFLEVSGHAEAFGVEMLTEDVVGVAGWSSREKE